MSTLNLAIFFTDKEYTNEECEAISLEQHLSDVERLGSSPDFWDSYDKMSKATDNARRAAYNGHDCIIVDLDADATDVLETFNASDYEDYLK